MYDVRSGLFAGVPSEDRTRMVGELSEHLADVSSALEDACDGAHALEKNLNRILFGEIRENPFEKLDSGIFRD